jgi:16S rRNA (uracil1498-N3)-methyltransferase
MTRRRWIADEVHGDTAALVGDHAAHLARVLRAEVGQEFDIAVGSGIRRGTITSVSNARVEFALEEELAVRPAPDVTLALAIFKFDRMEWAIEKCTEIGVTRIVPLIAARTDAHLAKAAVKRRDRWERIAVLASEQSRRVAPPVITAPIKLKELREGAVMAAHGETARIILSETERGLSLRDAVAADAEAVILAVGPEGGWTGEELEWFGKSGWVSASLGNTILRAETATIVACALALDALRMGDNRK